MANALLFLLGFASITGVYEVAKTSKKGNTGKLERNVKNIENLLK